jgi:hypothetical protein
VWTFISSVEQETVHDHPDSADDYEKNEREENSPGEHWLGFMTGRGRIAGDGRLSVSIVVGHSIVLELMLASSFASAREASHRTSASAIIAGIPKSALRAVRWPVITSLMSSQVIPASGMATMPNPRRVTTSLRSGFDDRSETLLWLEPEDIFTLGFVDTGLRDAAKVTRNSRMFKGAAKRNAWRGGSRARGGQA